MASSSPPAPPISKPTNPVTIHHLKLAATDVAVTHTFYTTILPFTDVPTLAHRTPSGRLYGAFFTTTVGGLLVEVRENAAQAQAQKGFDPVTWGAPTREDLHAWAAWVASKGVKHSRVFRGVKGWLVCFEDPDGKIVRVYTTLEEHAWCEPDKDDYWLKTPN